MKKLFLLIFIIAGLITGLVFITADKAVAPVNNTTPTAKSNTSSSFDKTTFSTTDPSSVWVIVNKQNPIVPKTHEPNDLVIPDVPLRVPGNESMQLRKEAATALESMAKQAKAANINLMLSSGYRSYNYQVDLYSGYVKTQGQAVADTQSARPGYSEHQTGFAADLEPTSKICEVEDCFADTLEGKWLAANSYKYGYILRYTKTNQALTGYKDESWHFRYVGVKLSTMLHNTDTSSLEEFFSVSGGPNY